MGRGPAVLAAFVSVGSFDFFFVPPRFTFAVSDFQYLLTFAVMLTVALIIGQLTAGLRYQARVASYREERARVLYEFARDMSSLLLTEDVVAAATKIIANTFRAKVAILVPDARDRLTNPAGGPPGPAIDVGAAQWAYDKAQPAGAGTDTLAGNENLYLPLRAPMRTRGVLVIKPDNPRILLVPEQRRHLDTFAALTAIALERVHYVEIAQQALINMESERLRNSLLSALSHDLRTPLAALVGLAESLTMTRPALSGAQHETAQAIADEARRMGALVNNLLEMARIESGEVKLRRQWQSLAGGRRQRAQGGAAGARQSSRRSGRAGRLAAGRVRRDADRARPVQPRRERVEVHASRHGHHHRRGGRRRHGRRERERHRARDREGAGGGDLRQVHARRAGVRDARRRPGTRDQPRDRRGAPAGASGPSAARAAARGSRSRCRSARRRKRPRKSPKARDARYHRPADAPAHATGRK